MNGRNEVEKLHKTVFFSLQVCFSKNDIVITRMYALLMSMSACKHFKVITDECWQPPAVRLL